MDEGRKRVLWICASINAAAPRVLDLQDAKNPSRQFEIMQDTICKAERIIKHIVICAGRKIEFLERIELDQFAEGSVTSMSAGIEGSNYQPTVDCPEICSR
jgi:hypothetical protein